MMPEGKQLSLSDLYKGYKVQHSFSVNEEKMRAFAFLSGDNSCIHRDSDFARYHGFKDRVVYGALQIAELSYLVGMLLPGDFGLAADWHISFHSPLYVNDAAILEAELVHLSVATKTVKLKFTIRVADRLIAAGTAQSMVLEPPTDIR